MELGLLGPDIEAHKTIGLLAGSFFFFLQQCKVAEITEAHEKVKLKTTHIVLKPEYMKV